MLDALTEGLLADIAHPLLAAGGQIWLGLATALLALALGSSNLALAKRTTRHWIVDWA